MQHDRPDPDNAEFIGRVGHELRTPLNAILGFSTLLLRDATLSARQRERIVTIESAGQRLLAGLNRLLQDADIAPGRYAAGAGAGPDAAPQPAELPAPPAPRRLEAIGGCVMVVDDTPANVQILSEALEGEGLQVMSATSGEDALAQMRQVLPDLILLDVQMPGIGGFGAFSELQADPATRDIPVIFLTVISDTATKVAAFRAGAVDYVTKPFHVDEVIARVSTQLRLVHSQKQLERLNADLEARVAERTGQLEAAIRELQALCSSMAHDLRGPLGALDGFSALLEGMLQEATDGRTRHYLGRIRAGVKQMDALTEALLSLARLSLREHRGEPVDLGELASRALASRQAAEPERVVEVIVEEGLAAQGDRALVAVLIEQLVDNAWKFTSREPVARIAVGRAGEKAGVPVFYVRDNGTGFDMALSDKLFKPFQRLHLADEFSGLGAGLAMVERIVMRHGGRVWAEAAEGDGATFFFTLAAPA